MEFSSCLLLGGDWNSRHQQLYEQMHLVPTLSMLGAETHSRYTVE